jgi:hypothetical protein
MKTQSDDPALPMQARPPAYRSYLLRFWAERGEQLAASAWRFSLEDPLTGQRRGFPSFEALVAWLQSDMQQAEINDAQPADPDARGSAT